MSDEPVRLDVWPVTWRDAEGVKRNEWRRNLLTNEIEPWPGGDPLYTTDAPDPVSEVPHE